MVFNDARKRELIRQAEVETIVKKPSRSSRVPGRRRRRKSVHYLYTLNENGTLCLDESFETAKQDEELARDRRAAKLEEELARDRRAQRKAKQRTTGTKPTTSKIRRKLTALRRAKTDPTKEEPGPSHCVHSTKNANVVPKDETELNSEAAMAQRRMWKALQLTLCISRISEHLADFLPLHKAVTHHHMFTDLQNQTVQFLSDHQEIPGLEKLSLSDAQFDRNVFGSLMVKPLVVTLVRRLFSPFSV